MSMEMRPPPRGVHLVIMVWGVSSVIALLMSAVYRLAPYAVEVLQGGELALWHYVLIGVWTVFMAYSEGYRGFHKRFSPRVVARAYHLGAHPTPLHVVLALPFCLSLFHTTKRQRIVSSVFLLFLLLLILAVRQLAQPWRGIVDVGVVVGLALGMMSIGYFFVAALGGRIPTQAALPPTEAANSGAAPVLD